jgi:hypothetical protein
MDEQQQPQDSRFQAPCTERAPAYDDHEVGYEAAMPMLQGGLAAAAWREPS